MQASRVVAAIKLRSRMDSLGWRKNIGSSKLQSKKVLHWNGSRKPWKTVMALETFVTSLLSERGRNCVILTLEFLQCSSSVLPVLLQCSSKDGLYKEMWLPHRQRFDSLLKPYSAGDTGGSTQRRGTQRVGVLSVRIYVGPCRDLHNVHRA